MQRRGLLQGPVPERRLRSAGSATAPMTAPPTRPPVARRDLKAGGLLLLAWLLLPGGAGWAGVTAPAPGARALCPVCGMFVAKYPAWVSTVVWRDGQAHHFDGVKDLCRFLQDLPRFAPGRQASEVATVVVTDYYGLTLVEANQAWYVLGSDVTGPMGHELVPLASAEEAREFMADHGGQVLRFGEITPQVLNALEGGGMRP